MNKTLSIIQANRLYLATMLLVVSVGALLQGISFSWGLLLTEVVLILLPTLWMLRHNQVNLRQSAGLYKIRASLVLVAAMLGAGAWLVTSLVEQIMIQITGYLPPTPEGMLPSTYLQAGLIFLAFVVAAPICEEILFRGSIQPAYQNQTSKVVAILVPSLMFALYHFRLQGLPALLIISLLLGYTYWRTQSLTFTIILHAANNFLAAIVLIRAGLFPAFELPFPSLQASAFGILLLVVGLVLLQRLMARPTSSPEEEKQTVYLNPWKIIWPILLAVVLFAVIAVQEIIQAKNQTMLPLDGTQLPITAQWIYEIQHKGNETIGTAICDWHKSATTANLSCQQEYEAFEVQIGNSYFSSSALLSRITVAWNTETLNLSSLYQEKSTDYYQNSWQIQEVDDGLVINISTQDTSPISLDFPAGTLVQEEWGWRLMGLSFEQFGPYKIQYLTPLTWREETQDSGPVIKSENLIISGPESIEVPAGEFQAWKVELSNGEKAWYSVEQPHILLRFDANMVNYLLADG